MNQGTQPYNRSYQILSLLHKHGQLSINGIQELLEPEIKSKRVREIMDRLCTQGLVAKRERNRLFPNHYWLTRDKTKWPKIASKLNIHLADFDTPKISRRGVYTCEAIAIWLEKIQRLVPEAFVLKKDEIASNPVARELLAKGRLAEENWPEILLIVANEEDELTVIAVDQNIEWMGYEKIKRKMKAYINTSSIDGILIITPNEALPDHYEKLWPTIKKMSGLKNKAAGNHSVAWVPDGMRLGKHEMPLLSDLPGFITLPQWVEYLGDAKSRIQ